MSSAGVAADTNGVGRMGGICPMFTPLIHLTTVEFIVIVRAWVFLVPAVGSPAIATITLKREGWEACDVRIAVLPGVTRADWFHRA